ncbi:hypothetical protein [Paenibacillus sp. FSL R7-0179]|uniref:hypothetical protein n=1 Tax=Paenibacillus sp. FSL R7-0179 TaxID=2921672 RepID=UPI0030FC03E6
MAEVLRWKNKFPEGGKRHGQHACGITNVVGFSTISRHRTSAAPNVVGFSTLSRHRASAAPNVVGFSTLSRHRTSAVPNVVGFSTISRHRASAAPNVVGFSTLSRHRASAVPNVVGFSTLSVSGPDDHTQPIVFGEVIPEYSHPAHAPRHLSTLDENRNFLINEKKPKGRWGACFELG